MAGTTRSQSRRLLVARLLGTPGLNHTQIAKKAGCSERTVSRVAAEIRPEEDDELEQLAREYRRLVNIHLPMERRVEILRQAAESVGTNPFAALKAIQRADDLSGVVTKRDELGKRQEQPPPVQPMFILPPDAEIRVRRSIEQPEPERAAINITPEKVEP